MIKRVIEKYQNGVCGIDWWVIIKTENGFCYKIRFDVFGKRITKRISKEEYISKKTFLLSEDKKW